MWCAPRVNNVLFTALSVLTLQQAEPMQETMKCVNQCLKFIVSQEYAVLTHRKNNMVLAVHGNTSYLNEENVGTTTGQKIPNSWPNNGAVLKVAKIMQVMMSVAAEA